MGERELLSVQKLSLSLKTRRGDVPLVKNVSFTLSENRILGLIGESGSGKSLTCLAIMGLLPAVIRQTSGVIRFQGSPLTHLPQPQFRAMRGSKIAMILQNPMSCFDVVFTIRKHFTETVLSHEKMKKIELNQRVEEALYAVGFENPAEILDVYPFQLSGGMLQRVMLAISLLMRAPLLIADEPTTDLDVVSQTRVLKLLENIRDTYGTSILIVTHDLGVIARLSDDVAVMREGNIVDHGSVTDMFDGKRSSYTQALMDAHFSLYTTAFQRLDNQIPLN